MNTNTIKECPAFAIGENLPGMIYKTVSWQDLRRAKQGDLWTTGWYESSGGWEQIHEALVVFRNDSGMAVLFTVKSKDPDEPETDATIEEDLEWYRFQPECES